MNSGGNVGNAPGWLGYGRKLRSIMGNPPGTE